MSLNRRQTLFVEHYLYCDSLAEAVINAGYKTVNPHSTGGKLLQNPKVKAAIRVVQQEERLRHHTCRNQIAEMLYDLYHSSNKVTEKLRVLDRLSRLYGFY